MPTDEERDAALRVLRQDYYDDVRACAENIRDEAVRRAKDGESDLRDWLLEHVHETCDGHQRVIYTGLAIETLLFSDNDSAYVEEYGTDGIASDGAVKWSVLAYTAFERDVMEQLDALGMDVTADDLGLTPDDDDTDEDGDES